MTIGDDKDRSGVSPIDEADDNSLSPDADFASLVAHEDERFLEAPRGVRAARARFLALVALILLVYAAAIVALLWKDAHTKTEVAQLEETPVEVVVEKPPEPPKPPQPPAPKTPTPPPPKVKEDLSIARSAPRAPNEDQTKTQTKEAKTAAPTKLETPTQGQPQSTPATAPPKDAAPAETKTEEAAKPEDLTKPDAEALDKARPKATKEAKSKEAKAAPRVKKIPNALAALAGAPNLDATMSFAKPTPKTKIYGGTEDVRWMSEVQAMLEAKVQKLPHTAHYQAGGNVAICFHVDTSGHIIEKDFCKKSGYPDIDQLAMRALISAAPFPPPPAGLERGLIWGTTFDGQVPTLHFR